MSSRILEEHENDKLAPVPWQHVNVHLNSNGTAEVLPEEAAAEENRLAAQVEELEARLQAAKAQIKQAHEEGIREGQQLGRAQAAADMRATLDRLSQTIAEAATLRAQLRKEAESEVVSLAIAVARRVLHREVTLQPDAIQGIVAVALSKLQAQESCKVRLHPQHAAPVRTALERLMPGGRVEVAGDPALTPGDVVLECPRGRLDASIDSQLAEIERGLADRIGTS